MCEMCDKIKSAKTKRICYDLDRWHRMKHDNTSYAVFDSEDIIEMQMADYTYCPKCGNKI